MSSGEFKMSSIDTWLQPLSESEDPCGKDLEYDGDFLELIRISQGKPETQFGPGEAPDWREVLDRSDALMGRTRDLRVALLWLRAGVNLRGFSALSPGLRLIRGMISNFWEHLHPLRDPDDGDAYARVNALSILPLSEGLLGDLRQCVLFNLRGTGVVRVRSILVALNQLTAKAGEASLSKEQLAQMMVSAIEQNPDFRDQPRDALADIRSLAAVMNESFGFNIAPDLSPLIDLLKGVDSLMPEREPEPEPKLEIEVGGVDSTGSANAQVDSCAASPSKAALGSVTSRDDALRAIDMVCEFLDRTEPTNPAQFFLRRARRMINHNFLELLKELAPNALGDAARLMGVDPDSVKIES